MTDVEGGWTQRRLGDLLDIQNGFAFDSKHFTKDRGVPPRSGFGT